MFNRKEFNEKIQKEYKEFKTKILGLSKEEIYERSLEIVFKTHLSNYLQNEEIVDDITVENFNKIDNLTLDALYSLYLNLDNLYYFDDMCDDLLEEFNSDCFDDED